MARLAGTKSSVPVDINKLLDALSPFRGTPLKVNLSTGWVNSVSALGIVFEGAEVSEEPEGGEEEKGEARAKFEVA